MRTQTIVSFSSVAVLACATGAAFAQPPEAFYKGTQITMHVGSGAGGGYDATGRVVARNIARHIPGNPVIVVSNMPGAGGLTNANFMYNSAPRNGSAIAASFNTVMMLPLFGDSAAKFDPRKFGWIGSTDKQQGICVVRKDVPVTSIEDARKREVLAGATAVNANPGIYPTILNSMFGTKFKIVSGYNTSGMRLALERGEIESICGLAIQTHMAANPHWFSEKLVNVIVQFGLEKNAMLADVPLAIDMLSDPAERKVYELIVLPQEIGRPFITPPGVPADRLAALQEAFGRMLKDSRFLEESRRMKQSIDPMDGKAIMALWERAYSAPKEVVARAAKFANPGK